MKNLLYIASIIIFIAPSSLWAQEESEPLYLNAEAPISERVDDLLKRMTIEEKIGQMTQINISVINTTGEQKDVMLDAEKARNAIKKHHIGSFLNGEAVPPEQWYRYSKELQEIALEESRLNIPIIYGIDHIHGASYVANSTLFPQQLNLGATFNNELAYQMGKVTVMESADLGHHWIFAPVLDIAMTPYWPRYWETFGESPYLAGNMGREFIKGIQTPHEEIAPYRVAATAKHFLGYSMPRSGWDRTPVYISDQRLHEIHRPSFQEAVDAGVKTIMINSGEINGVPVHASKEILTDLLRHKMGFEGVTVTDWADIQKLYNYHNVAHDMYEATFMAIDAGIDMSMTPNDFSFNEAMYKLVENGLITEDRLDVSVRRILRLKFELGLFENPYPRNDRFDRIGSAEHQQMALNAARESLVLLRNQQELLPLKPDDTKRLLLAGPTIDSKRNLNGGWTYAWQGARHDSVLPERVPTIYDVLRQTYPSARIDTMHHAGAPGSKRHKKFTKLAQKSDAVIIAAGEEPYTEFIGNITDLTLPKEQLYLIAAANKTGTPTALILVEGRPRVITSIADDTEAILFAGIPGFQGAQAIADVLSGAVNPSGKLNFSYPAYTGHFDTFMHKSSAVYFFNSDEANFIQQESRSTSLFQFGSGLSYTDFEYQNFSLSDTVVTEDDTITAKVTVTNTGDLAGKESVLWFLSDEVGRITRPVRQLAHYEKKLLEPGEERTFSLQIDTNDLTYPDENGDPVLEPGYFTITVGNQQKRFLLKTEDNPTASPFHKK